MTKKRGRPRKPKDQKYRNLRITLSPKVYDEAKDKVHNISAVCEKAIKEELKNDK